MSNFDRKRFVTTGRTNDGRWQVFTMRWMHEPLPAHWIVADAGPIFSHETDAVRNAEGLAKGAGTEYISDVSDLGDDFRAWFIANYDGNHDPKCEIVKYGICTCMTHAVAAWRAEHGPNVPVSGDGQA